MEGSSPVYYESMYVTVEYDEQNSYFYFTRPAEGWDLGDYELDFFIGETYSITLSFTIE